MEIHNDTWLYEQPLAEVRAHCNDLDAAYHRAVADDAATRSAATERRVDALMNLCLEAQEAVGERELREQRTSNGPRFTIIGRVTHSRHPERIGLFAISDAGDKGRIVAYRATRELAARYCANANRAARLTFKQKKGVA